MSVNYQLRAIDAPPAQPPVTSFEIACDLISDDEQWHQGITWRPEQIHGGGVAALDYCAQNADLDDTLENLTQHVQTAVPFVVFAEDHCSVLTGSRAFAEYEARARRQLAASESFWIANEFQLGTLRDAGSLPNVALKDAIALTGASTPIGVLAGLESFAGAFFTGRRLMIHMTPQTLALLNESGMLTRAGQKWLTTQGSIVCCDAGYTTEGGNTYMYATLPVQYRLSAVDVPATWGDGLGFIDYQLNDVRLFAQREVLIQVDGTFMNEPGSSPADAMFKMAVDVPAISAI